ALILVDADHVVAAFGQAGPGHQAHVARPNHRDFHDWRLQKFKVSARVWSSTNRGAQPVSRRSLPASPRTTFLSVGRIQWAWGLPSMGRRARASNRSRTPCIACVWPVAML